MSTYHYKNSKFINIKDPFIHYDPEKFNNYKEFLRDSEGYYLKENVTGFLGVSFSLYKWDNVRGRHMCCPYLMQIEVHKEITDVFIDNVPDLLEFYQNHSQLFINPKTVSH